MRLLTPPGTAGVAVVAFPVEQRRLALSLLRSSRGAPLADTGSRPVRAELWLDGEQVDDVLLVDRGWLGVELHMHGAPSIWARLSAFVPAEAVPQQVPAWQRVLRAAMSAEVVALACEQSGFDFAGELAGLAALPRAVAVDAVAACWRRSRVALAMVQPTPLILTGRQNVGKSTLFNRLLLRERSLAGPEPGLTRDAVREPVMLSGFLYDMVDTAGEGPVATAVDADAIQQGRRLRQDAVVVLVVPAGIGLSHAEEQLVVEGAVLVRSKGDLVGCAGPPEPGLRLSSTADSPVLVRATLGDALRRHRGLTVAGSLGGPAALDAEQWALVRAVALRLGIEGDCGADG